MATKTTKIVKRIKIDADKCSGCRACEVICSAYHYKDIVNPKRSRVRVFWDEFNDLYVPILAGNYSEAECNGRHVMVIKGKEYGECSFCRSSCESRDIFKEPDTGLPLKCDMCGEPMPEGGPMCVQWCLAKALTYEQFEEESKPSIEEEEEKAVEL